jgi:hypothetical protein
MGEEEIDGRLDHGRAAAEIDLMIPPMAAGHYAGQQAAGPRPVPVLGIGKGGRNP